MWLKFWGKEKKIKHEKLPVEIEYLGVKEIMLLWQDQLYFCKMSPDGCEEVILNSEYGDRWTIPLKHYDKKDWNEVRNSLYRAVKNHNDRVLSERKV